MKKRIRKKLCKREFRKYAFSVRGRHAHDVKDFGKIFLAWADSNGLLISGRLGYRMNFVVERCSVCCSKATTSIDDCLLVQSWLDTHGVTDVFCSALWDINYGNDPLEEK